MSERRAASSPRRSATSSSDAPSTAARPAGWSFSPLDDRLGLTQEGFSPEALRLAVRQAGKAPFASASEDLRELANLCISPAQRRKACVCDGLNWNGSVFALHLLPLGFVGILDVVHLYAAAQAAGSDAASAWALYERWLRWAWSGAVKALLAGLRSATARLGGGAEAVLQVRAAYLSEDGRAERYWARPRLRGRSVGSGRLGRRS